MWILWNNLGVFDRWRGLPHQIFVASVIAGEQGLLLAGARCRSGALRPPPRSPRSGGLLPPNDRGACWFLLGGVIDLGHLVGERGGLLSGDGGAKDGGAQ